MEAYHAMFFAIDIFGENVAKVVFKEIASTLSCDEEQSRFRNVSNSGGSMDDILPADDKS